MPRRSVPPDFDWGAAGFGVAAIVTVAGGGEVGCAGAGPPVGCAGAATGAAGAALHAASSAIPAPERRKRSVARRLIGVEFIAGPPIEESCARSGRESTPFHLPRAGRS